MTKSFRKNTNPYLSWKSLAPIPRMIPSANTITLDFNRKAAAAHHSAQATTPPSTPSREARSFGDPASHNRHVRPNNRLKNRSQASFSNNYTDNPLRTYRIDCNGVLPCRSHAITLTCPREFDKRWCDACTMLSHSTSYSSETSSPWPLP